jgi:hypothetical protein
LENRGDRILSESIGKTISVYYNDTFNTVSLKTGKLVDFDDFSLKILEEGSVSPLLISIEKCIRLEVNGVAQLE